MTQLTTVAPPDRLQRLDWRRLILVLSLALYGAALRGALLPISLLTKTPLSAEPEHLALVPSVILSASGALAGASVGRAPCLSCKR